MCSMGAVSSCWRKDNGPSVGFDVFSDCQCPTDVDHRVEMKGMVALPLSPYLTTVAGQMRHPSIGNFGDWLKMGLVEAQNRDDGVIN